MPNTLITNFNSLSLVKDPEVNGILLVFKPAGPTSHDIVDFIRSKFKIKKVGHAGTLDPFAEGLLIILLGKATKRQSEFMNCDKEYLVNMKLGISTDSGDSQGKTIYAPNRALPTRKEFEEALKSFIGKIFQEAPMFSAVKFKGKALYKFARKNQKINLPKRLIEIKSIKILEYIPPYVRLLIICSKGTYIRQLCHDIGQYLGCGAHAAELKRTASGSFKIEDALKMNILSNITIDELKKKVVS